MTIQKRTYLTMILCFAAIGVHLLGTFAFADEAAGEGSSALYDQIMMILNFCILVGVIVKFGRKPIMNFLYLRRETLARDIKTMEDQRNAAEQKTKEIMALVEAGEEHISRIKDKIKIQGRKEKERIIEEAKQQSRYMMENAQKRIGNQIDHARQTFKTELIDAALELTVQRLPQIITDDDHNGLVDNFIKEAFQS